jgi:hypothetical protein
MTNCLECQNLSRVYESKLTKYLAARSAVLYRISTEFAAKQQVDMERAKNDMEDHLLTCPKVRCVALVPLQGSSAWKDYSSTAGRDS